MCQQSDFFDKLNLVQLISPRPPPLLKTHHSQKNGTLQGDHGGFSACYPNIIYLKIGDWKRIFLLERLPCIVPCYFQGVTELFFFFSTPEVGEGDLGIGIGGKVLTGLFLQVQDLRNVEMMTSLRTKGWWVIPRCCVIIFTSYNIGELILGLTSFLLIDLCTEPSVLLSLNEESGLAK